MNGHKFEYKCAKMLRRKGFHHVKVTPTSGDQGVDIIGYKWFSKYAFQCKYYSYPVGNKAVQEVYAGGKYYDCDRFVVMTNGTYTRAARNAAEKLDVQLWENCSLLKSASPFWILFNVVNWDFICWQKYGHFQQKSCFITTKKPVLPLLDFSDGWAVEIFYLVAFRQQFI